MNTILTVTGCAHPKAEVQRTDNEAGLLIFRWLNASENPVDSGNSVARFTPSSTVVNGVTVWDEPTEAQLVTAIEAA
jgi:hypothetical protein